jgi:hypothetical protein
MYCSSLLSFLGLNVYSVALSKPETGYQKEEIRGVNMHQEKGGNILI